MKFDVGLGPVRNSTGVGPDDRGHLSQESSPNEPIQDHGKSNDPKIPGLQRARFVFQQEARNRTTEDNQSNLIRLVSLAGER